MSYKKRTYDTDEITLRKVFAKSFIDNTNIPAMKVLTADGAGSTYWANPSTLGLNPSFNQINTEAGNFTSDLSYNIFTITTENIGSALGPGSNELVIYNQSFNRIDVSGNNSVYSFNSNTNNLQTSFRLVGTNGISIRSDTAINTIYFDSQGVPVSTSLFSFQKAKVLSNVSSVTGDISSLEGYFLNAASPSSALTFVGLGDVELTTDSFNNAIYFGLNQSTGTVSSLTSLIESISTGYVTIEQFSTGLGAVSTISQSNFSTSVSTSYGINSNLSITVYNLPFNQYTLLSQFNTGSNTLARGLSTLSTNYTPLPALYSSITSIDNRFSTLALPSSVCTLTIYGGNANNFTANTVIVNEGDLSTFSTTIGGTINDLTSQVNTLSTLSLSGLSSLSSGITFAINRAIPSTVIGLGTSGYISSFVPLYSSISGLGTVGYLSSLNPLYSSIVGLGTAGYISSFDPLYSSVQGLGTLGFISSLQPLYSSVQGLGTTGYISSLSTMTLSTTNLITSSITFRDTQLNTNQLVAVKNGQLQLNGQAITGGGGSGIQFFSTSFASTIYYEGNNGALTATLTATPGVGYFTTADVYLDKFSSYITSTSKLSVDYYYNLRFGGWQYGTGTNNRTTDTLFFFSTGILYENNLDMENILIDMGIANKGSNTDGQGSNWAQENIVSRRQRFQLSTGGVMANYTAPIKIFHLFDSFYNDGDSSTFYYAGFSNNDVNVYVQSTTAITIGIQN